MIHAVISYEDGRVAIHDAAADNVGTKFQPGFYSAKTSMQGLSIMKQTLSELHTPFPSAEAYIAIKAANAFFKESMRKQINDLGFVHKLGMIFHGKQGTGKTALANYIAHQMVTERDAIVLFCNNTDTISGAVTLASELRKIQDNPIVFIADEFERFAKNAEAAIKNFLDGNDSIDNSLFIGATNYIDRVPDTIKDRPSRIKYCFEIKGIEQKETALNIAKKIVAVGGEKAVKDKVLEELITVPITIDEIKHIVIDCITNAHLPTKNSKPLGFLGKNGTDALEEEEDWGVTFADFIVGWDGEEAMKKIERGTNLI